MTETLSMVVYVVYSYQIIYLFECLYTKRDYLKMRPSEKAPAREVFRKRKDGRAGAFRVTSASYQQVRNDDDASGEEQRPARGAPERRICGEGRYFQSRTADRRRPNRGELASLDFWAAVRTDAARGTKADRPASQRDGAPRPGVPSAIVCAVFVPLKVLKTTADCGGLSRFIAVRKREQEKTKGGGAGESRAPNGDPAAAGTPPDCIFFFLFPFSVATATEGIKSNEGKPARSGHFIGRRHEVPTPEPAGVADKGGD